MPDTAGPKNAAIADLTPRQRTALVNRLRAKLAAGGQAVPITPIPRLARLGPLPASIVQEQIWLHQQIAPQDTSYNVTEAVRLTGRLDTGALTRAIQSLVDRHEILRTTFDLVDGAVTQHIGARPRVDVSLTAAADDLPRLLDPANDKPFDLRHQTPVRAWLVRMSDDEHVLVFSLHHIACDGWSLEVLIRDLMVLYSGYVENRRPQLPVLQVQYADYAWWQRSRGDLAADLAYWRSVTADLPSRMPVLGKAGAAASTAGAKLVTSYPRAIAQRLGEVAGEAQATLFMALMAGLHAVIHRYCPAAVVGVGTPLTNRGQRETKDVVGPFLNTVPIFTRWAQRPAFRDLVRQVRDQTLAAMGHSCVPLERIAEQAGVAGPLFQALFSMRTTDHGGFAAGGLAIEVVEMDRGTSKYDLTVEFEDTPAGLVARLGYRTDRFDDDEIEQFARHLGTALTEFADAPDRPVADMGRVWGNDTAVENPPTHTTVARMFQDQALSTPDAIAITHDTGQLTYQTLLREVNALAAELSGRADVVFILADRGPELIIAMLATLVAGGAYVPIDAATPPSRVRSLLDRTRPSVILTERRHRDLFPVDDPRIVLLSPNRPAATPPDVTVDGSQLAYVMFTSGSTGVPKGVQVTQGGLANYVGWAASAYGCKPGEPAIVHSSIGFDLTVTSVFPPLVTGGRLELVPEGHGVDGLAEALRRTGRSGVLKLTPSHLVALAELTAPGRPRCLVVGGEALHYAQVASWRAAGATVVNEYGPTEAVVGCCVHEVDGDGSGDVPVGKPLPRTSAHVLDSELRPCPAGVTGELYVGGVGLARGYLGQPGLTAERFVPDPSTPGARLYRTGDLARRRADGQLLYLGRRDDQVQLRGYRVELGEVQAVLMSHPDVRHAVAAVDGESLVGYVVPRPGARVDAGELAGFLRASLPHYLVPAAYVSLAELPLTPNGKVDRSALPAITGPRGTIRAKDGLSGVVAQAYESVLGMPAGIDDDFFAMGGNSLSAARLVSRLSTVTGVLLPVRAVFEAPTPRQLATRATGRHPVARPLTPVNRATNELPLSFGQERLWVLQQLDPSSPFYSTVETMRVTGALDQAALCRALDALVERHEILRTTFHLTQNGVVQRVGPATPVAVETTGSLREFVQRPFDLATGPLFRVLLLDEGSDRHLIAFGMHHIVTDGWSTVVLQEELVELYQGVSLPALPVQYGDYAVWQRHALTEDVLADLTEYWCEQLAGAPQMLNLPTDHERGQVATFRGARCTTRLAAEQIDALQKVVSDEGATLFMGMLAVFTMLLHQQSGQEDLLVGTPVAGRDTPELEGVIGFLVNTLVLRADLSGRPTFRQLLRRIRQSCLDAYSHADLPFERLVDRLRPDRDFAVNPLVQAMFTLQPAPAALDTVDGMSFEPVRLAPPAAKFDLLMAACPTDDGVEMFCEYSTVLFEASTARRLLDGYTNLLRAAVASPDVPIGALRSGRPEIQHWTGGPAVPTDDVITQIAAMAAAHPDIVAVTDEHERVTYADLLGRVGRLAHELRERGVGTGDLVGIYLERSAEFVAAMLAVLASGAGYIPLESPGSLPRLRATVDRMAVLITTDAPNDVDTVVLDPRAAKTPADLPAVDRDGIAYVIYTSGSSGTPKGVAVGHRQLAGYVAAIRQRFPLEPGASCAVFTALEADLGYTAVFGALCGGGTLHIVSANRALDTSWLAERFAHQPIDLLKAVPTHLAALLRAPDTRHLLPRRWLVLGGEPTDWDLVDTVRSLRPECRIANHYGPTETTVGVLTHEVGTLDTERSHRTVPLTAALSGMTVTVRDACDHLVAPGVPGELCVNGVGVAYGYLGAPAATADRFRPDSLAAQPGSRVYRTGDRVRYDETGAIDFLGRTDRQVKIRGVRIEPGEVETALRLHPAVSQAVVVPDRKGRLIAFAVTHPQAVAVYEGMRRYHLPNNLAVVQLNRNETDYIYREIFELQAYLRHGITIRPGDQIVDVGANIGLFSLFAHLSAPGVRVAAFEPNPDAFRALQANLELHGADATCFEHGLAEAEGTAEYTRFAGFSLLSGYHTDVDTERDTVVSYLRNQETAGVHGAGALAAESEQVLADRFAATSMVTRLRPLGAVLTELGTRVHLLKINVEKSELAVLRGIGPAQWANIDQIVAEVDLDEHLPDILDLLRGNDFDYVVEQDGLLGGTALRYVYAVRRGSARNLTEQPGEPGTTPMVDDPVLRVSALDTFLQKRLSPHAVPAAIELVDEIPLTGNGKIDRQALLRTYQDAVRDRAAATPPQNDVERTIARIWVDLLGGEDVGRDDNFFDLGGNSLLVVEAHGRLRAELRVDFPVVELFRRPTVRRLAEGIQALAGEGPAGDQPATAARERAAARRRAVRRGGRK